MRRVLWLLIFICASPQAGAQSVPLNSLNKNQTRVGALDFKGAVVIPTGKNNIGGLSSLWVSPDGERVVALADIGRVFEGTLQWGPDETLQGVTFAPGYKLQDVGGKAFTKRADTEGLSRAADGSWLVSFERDHRIYRYPELKGVPQQIEAPPHLQDLLPRNEGLEGIVSFPDGRQLVLAEAAAANGHHRGWLWQDGHWLEFDYEGAPGFKPTDVTYLHEGSVLVLERRVNIFAGGFQAVVMQLDLPDRVAGQQLKGREIARLSPPLLTDNYEGIYARTRPDGLTQVFLVSDDNMNGIQQTILAVFLLSWVVH